MDAESSPPIPSRGQTEPRNRQWASAALGMLLALFLWQIASAVSTAASPTPLELYVDPSRGDDNEAGTQRKPLRSVSAALLHLPEEVVNDVTIYLERGVYRTTGGRGMSQDCLVLERKMAPGVRVHLKGPELRPETANERHVVFDWRGAESVLVRNGEWSLSNIQVGTRRKDQRRGIVAEGPGLVNLRNVRVRTSSLSDAGLLARRSGRIQLYGTIELNEDLHDACGDKETFSAVVAEDHGAIRFMERDGASLSIGNGQLSASYYGCVRLGCASARITSWTPSNNIAINNSGRVDLHSTETVLRGYHRDNTLIGPESDGHILAENAHVVLESFGSKHAIYLQKSSTLYGGPFELRGNFSQGLVAMSGSIFVGIVKGDVAQVEAHTGAHITLERGSSVPQGKAIADTGATIVLPDGKPLR